MCMRCFAYFNKNYNTYFNFLEAIILMKVEKYILKDNIASYCYITENCHC